ncbi:hypothetical protein E4T56_gene13222 [Termitomyces sp. T112]|nr:hypothetical protein E4T56_gene13222 [Termitomyces sp. T112]
MTRHSDRAAPPISYSTEWSIHTKASSAEIFWHEMRSIFQSAVAISGSLLVEFSFTFVPVAFIGHFSTPALAALCLGSMTANLTGISILRGLSSPLETMLPSAHTSGRSDLLALWTQRTRSVSTASQSVLTTLACVTWQVGAALSTAVGVRVGHHLGTMDHRRARGAANASILLVLMTSIFLSSSYMVFREPLARLLSNDPEVIVEVVSVIPLVALLQIVDGNACVTSGLMRAMGRQVSCALNLSPDVNNYTLLETEEPLRLKLLANSRNRWRVRVNPVGPRTGTLEAWRKSLKHFIRKERLPAANTRGEKNSPVEATRTFHRRPRSTSEPDLARFSQEGEVPQAHPTSALRQEGDRGWVKVGFQRGNRNPTPHNNSQPRIVDDFGRARIGDGPSELFTEDEEDDLLEPVVTGPAMTFGWGDAYYDVEIRGGQVKLWRLWEAEKARGAPEILGSATARKLEYMLELMQPYPGDPSNCLHYKGQRFVAFDISPYEMSLWDQVRGTDFIIPIMDIAQEGYEIGTDMRISALMSRRFLLPILPGTELPW